MLHCPVQAAARRQGTPQSLRASNLRVQEMGTQVHCTHTRICAEMHQLHARVQLNLAWRSYAICWCTPSMVLVTRSGKAINLCVAMQLGPEWRGGTVVEGFKEDGILCGLQSCCG